MIVTAKSNQFINESRVEIIRNGITIHSTIDIFDHNTLIVEYIDYILISPFLAVFVYALLRKRNEILDMIVSLRTINPAIYFKVDTWKPVFKLSRWKNLSFSGDEVGFTLFVIFILITPLPFILFHIEAKLQIMLLLLVIPFMCVRHIIITDLNKNK